MVVNTGVFGLGGTKKTIPELINQINHGSELMEQALVHFLEMRTKRDVDKGYYGPDGLDYLKQMVTIQNRINNRIGKLWIVYNNEVKLYHKNRREELQNHFSNKNDHEHVKTRPPAPPQKHEQETHEHEQKTHNRETGKVYIAEEDFEPESDTELKLVLGHKYVLVDDNGDGWALVKDNVGNEGFVPIDFLSEQHVASSGRGAAPPPPPTPPSVFVEAAKKNPELNGFEPANPTAVIEAGKKDGPDGVAAAAGPSALMAAIRAGGKLKSTKQPEEPEQSKPPPANPLLAAIEGGVKLKRTSERTEGGSPPPPPSKNEGGIMAALAAKLATNRSQIAGDDGDDDDDDDTWTNSKIDTGVHMSNGIVEHRIPGFYYAAEYSYIANKDNEIDLQAGKVYYVIDNVNTWAYVESLDGNVGFVPSSYLLNIPMVHKNIDLQPGYYYYNSESNSFIKYISDKYFENDAGERYVLYDMDLLSEVKIGDILIADENFNEPDDRATVRLVKGNKYEVRDNYYDDDSAWITVRDVETGDEGIAPIYFFKK